MSADPCTWCGGSRTTAEGEACPPCDGTGRAAPVPIPSAPRAEASGCLLLTPDMRLAIGMRLDALETGFDQREELLDGLDDHEEGCDCPRCLARWMDTQMRATVAEIRRVLSL